VGSLDIVHALALLSVEYGPHRLLSGSKAGGDVKKLVGVDRWTSPELAHKVPTGGALEEGMHDLRLSNARELGIALGKTSYEVPQRHTGLLSAPP
jgi:hypothetical protein